MYDAINGLAGIGRVLLTALTSGHNMTEPGLLAALETLTTMINTRHGNRPGWWLPAGEHPPTVTVHQSGAVTTGMAHGIAGPLALLATAHTAGWSVAGQQTAIQEAAHWLLRRRTNATPRWPPYVTGDEPANRAAAAVTAAFNSQLAFAFQHLDNGAATDEPGLLTGSAGVALALADHGQLPAPPVPARWDSILLLS